MKISVIILGVLSIIGGIFAIATPGATFLALGWVAGISLIGSGIGSIIYYFASRKSQETSLWMLIGGIFSIIMGLLITGNALVYTLTELFLVYSYASGLILIGILQMRVSFACKKAGASWVGILIASLFTIAIGIFSFMHPVLTMFTIGMLTGFWLISRGIDLISFASAKSE